MKRRRKWLIVLSGVVRILLLVLVAAALISVGKKAYAFGYQVFSPETISDPPGKKVAVTITDDITVTELAELLKSKHLIKDERVFRVQYQLSEHKGKLKGGNYILTTAMTAEEMLSEMSPAEEETEEGVSVQTGQTESTAP